MTKQNKDLQESAVRELRFANLQVESLLGVLGELESLTGSLETAIIQNARQRHHLDKLIHAKLIFNNS